MAVAPEIYDRKRVLIASSLFVVRPLMIQTPAFTVTSDRTIFQHSLAIAQSSSAGESALAISQSSTGL